MTRRYPLPTSPYFLIASEARPSSVALRADLGFDVNDTLPVKSPASPPSPKALGVIESVCEPARAGSNLRGWTAGVTRCEVKPARMRKGGVVRGVGRRREGGVGGWWSGMCTVQGLGIVRRRTAGADFLRSFPFIRVDLPEGCVAAPARPGPARHIHGANAVVIVVTAARRSITLVLPAWKADL